MSSPKAGTVVGVVEGLARFPVKGMRGEALPELHLGWHGPDGDRGFALLRLADSGGLPFLSLRRCPLLARYAARMVDRNVVVTTPSGVDVDLRDPALLAELEDLAGEHLHLQQLWSHATDAADVSLVTSASVASASKLTNRDLDGARFRANILIKPINDPRPFPEDRWTGRTLTGGTESTAIHVARTTQRCTAINIDPITGEIDPGVFQTVRDGRRNRLGVYASVQRPGTYVMGDALTVRN